MDPNIAEQLQWMLARLAHKRVNSGDGESTATDTPEYGDWRTFPPEGMGLTVRHLQPESCPEPLLQHLQQPPLWGRFPTDQSLRSGNTSLTISAYPRAPQVLVTHYGTTSTRQEERKNDNETTTTTAPSSTACMNKPPACKTLALQLSHQVDARSHQYSASSAKKQGAEIP